MKQPIIDKALKELENYFGGINGFTEGTNKFVTSILEQVYDCGHADGYSELVYNDIESAIEDFGE